MTDLLIDKTNRSHEANPSLTRRQVLKALGLSALVLPFQGSCAWLPSHRTLPFPVPTGQTVRVTVLGSGLTGLCAGALLARLGFDVDVLEAHPSLLGGHARTFSLAGVEFCAGPQYVWGFGDAPDAIGTRILSFLNLQDDVPFRSLDPSGFERIAVGDDPPLDVPMGLDHFRARLVAQFPDEEPGLTQFFDELALLYKGASIVYQKGLYLEGSLGMMRGLIFSGALSLREKLALSRRYKKTLADLFDECALSVPVRRLLFGHSGVFAEAPGSLSVGVYAAATGFFHSGASYPTRGFESLVQGLAKSIRRSGGRVFVNKRAVRLRTVAGTIRDTHCADGTVYESDLVISTLAPRLTCSLLGECDVADFRYEPSHSLLACYFVVDGYDALAALDRRNFWWQTDRTPVDYGAPDMTSPPTMLFASSRPTTPLDHPSHRSQERRRGMTVFAPGNFSQAQQAFAIGPAHYEDFKGRIADTIIATLEQHGFPDLRQCIHATRVLTPWDTKQELGAEQGNVYGRRPDVRNVLRKVREIQDADNLFIACATVGQAGVPTAFQTARILVERLTGHAV